MGVVLSTDHRADASPPGHSRVSTGRGLQAALLVASLALVAAVALIGRGWTDTSAGSWYDEVDKPLWTPPGPAFGIVWTVLYVSMAVAAWLIARHGTRAPQVRLALIAYLVQLGLNLGWTAVFFAAQRPGWAVVEICILLAAVVLTIARFAPVSRTAAWMLVPYLAWVTYAATLTIGIAVLNE